MRVAVHVEGRELFARLHLDEGDKVVLREHGRFLNHRILSTPPSVVVLSDLLFKPDEEYSYHSIAFENMSAAYDAKEKIEKAVATIEKEIIELIPPPEPVEPFVPEGDWYSHCLLLAQTRGGKTNAIRHRISQLLPQIAAGKASLILMEAKNVLSRELLNLAAVWEMRDRVVIIDPVDGRVGMNPFDVSDNSELAMMENTDRLSRIFSILAADLTGFQRTPFSMALRAMYVSDKRPSIKVLKFILRHGIDGLNIVGRLPDAVAEYFRDDFRPRSSNGNRGDARANDVINRLNTMLSNPVFDALFSAEKSNFNLLNKIQEGSLIVINANRRRLGGNPELYGRFWIEQANKTIWERFELPFHERTPTTFIIDEAQNYIKNDIYLAENLASAAESRLGFLLAMHHLGSEQVSSEVRGSLLTNTALKFAARTSEEIHQLARMMGDCDHPFIQNTPRHTFAFYGPGMDKAIWVKFPPCEFTDMPQMDEEQGRELRRLNRDAYNYIHKEDDEEPSERPPQAEQTPEPSPKQETRRSRTSGWR